MLTSQQKLQPRQPQRLGTINFRKYAQPYYIVERGSIDEQINFIYLSLGGKVTDEVELKQLEMVIHLEIRIIIILYKKNYIFHST